MPRILLTAFEPYLEWPDNSSWLTLIELTRLFDTTGRVVTRRYPVNLEGIIERLSEDLSLGFDYAIHLGQSPGSPVIKLETTGLNALASGLPIIADGPTSFRSGLPLEAWAQRLVSEGIPATVSHYAGNYMCNATLYLSHYIAESKGLVTQSCFIHLPLAPQQAARHLPHPQPLASMGLTMMAGAVAVLLGDLLQRDFA